ncbi:MAG: family 65 glycosyl hydrolase domain-containing protein [Bacteroidales bacterium]|nr:family 65 glycosyl hydrolase domain-containing protein [Bacteroidales bacterium]
MSPELKYDEWLIVEESFIPENNRASESIFSIGNGKMGQRANFEESYSGNSLQGSYIAGIYYPDKTRVGWWKNGYPEYFAKVLNSANWIGIDIKVNKQTLDLSKCTVREFRRVLNMKEGYLKRTFKAELQNGNLIEVESKRFLSIVDTRIGAIKYSIKAANFKGKLELTPYIDLDISNEDSNYGEKFWKEESKIVLENEGYLLGKTKKLDFYVCSGMKFNIEKNSIPISNQVIKIEKQKYIANSCEVEVEQNDTVIIYKYAANLSTQDYELADLIEETKKAVHGAQKLGFAQLLNEQANAWEQKWEESDIEIKGDISAQQAIRFNIFQLNQTYTGEDERLNIGPKGFTGEKYGGSTYWDTEAFALPFYLSTASPKASRNLLLYRYKHLGKAIENAEKLGFVNGAALYPMVTMNGEECHNEWEITFEEIHRNGAIAYAIFNYIRHTGDESYLSDYGLEVLIGISRFWSQRATLSPIKGKYVILGVTGPNEYENNVNNNWYTNIIASWTLEYSLESLKKAESSSPEKLKKLINRLDFDLNEETNKWKDIVQNMYYPVSEDNGIFLQQDGYLDKENILVQDINPLERPLNQNWSWDRILRSPFIKQADVLQGIYFFEEKYKLDTIRKNFYYYEPRTVHESSLSACIHAIIAAKIGDIETAYNMFLRTARLDLDDYNREVEEGLHITSMAGTWLVIVEGFGGLRVRNGNILINPVIPDKWDSYSFNIRFRGNQLNFTVNHKTFDVTNKQGGEITVLIGENKYSIDKGNTLSLDVI